jgi:hypothetical protein
VLAPEKVGQELQAKSIGEPVRGDSAATCSAALRFGHPFCGALLFAHAYASICLIAMDRIVFATFYAVRASLGIGRELDESLMSL